ncbi:leucine-rich repeat-containing protein 45-like [Prorops nasuta]|uniref:leucine-rich repeat-containing protein 45-like n=1 Tax=Prorops nasuta TaxID=863751 RepID=UPI0034CF562D
MALPLTRNFATIYMELCKQQRLRPLPIICITLPHSLDFTTDRVKMDDWGPILNALSLDRNLKSIGIRSRSQYRKAFEEMNSEEKARLGRAPVVLTRYVLECLSQSIGQCVRNSSNLTSLELEGIPLPADCLAVLCVGLTSTETLKHLSLQRTYIGDSGCELLCRTISNVQSIQSLNLAQCNLTSKSGPILAAALCKQKLSLYHDAWKESLRYREPNLEDMQGLRRLTLNDNSNIGDDALREIIEAVRDSLWLKALDLQRCGLTDSVANEILQLLEHNKTLVILDVRENSNLSDDFVREVERKLEENNNGSCTSEYRWLGLPQKNRRIASATCKKSPYGEVLPVRPKSAFAGQARRSYQSVLPRRRIAISKPDTIRRGGSRTLVSSPRIVEKRGQREHEPRAFTKARLYLDLQSQIRSIPKESKDKEEAFSSRTVCAFENLDSHEAEESKDPEETVRNTRRSIDEEPTKSQDETTDKLTNGFQEIPEMDIAEMSPATVEMVRAKSSREDRRFVANVPCKVVKPIKTKQFNDRASDYERVLAESNRKSVLLANERSRRENLELELRSMRKQAETKERMNYQRRHKAPAVAPQSLSVPSDREEMIEILKQLVDAKIEQERLSAELKRTDNLLAEEKSRRKAAEYQLQIMKSNVQALDKALREKQRDTEGSLLISRRSLDEICESFDKLFNMLDSIPVSSARSENARENATARADIERRFTYLVRKTKSENLNRECSMNAADEYDEEETGDYEGAGMSGYEIDVARKFAYSESDVRKKHHEPVPSIRLERNIGDNPDVVSPEARNAFTCKKNDFMSASDRARAIFAQIVGGDSRMDLNSHVG